MTINVENPEDNGSAIWACSTCERGGWCWDHTTALLEARTHARTCTDTIKIQHRHGPKPDSHRDQRIRQLREQHMTIRAIAAAVGLSNAGVIKSLKRTGQT